MDTSMADVAANPIVAFSISLAQSTGYCNVQRLDPENPRCARVVFSGKFVAVTEPAEHKFAKDALFERHPEMASWPADHSWKVHRVDLAEVWLIDIYGGASVVDVGEYYDVDMSALKGAYPVL
ncbi:protein CREG1 [Ochromonadaceae sp. CCMP2298]|nr:protein CREG1 [Ochromonadaceae sp. CCMP2298]